MKQASQNNKPAADDLGEAFNGRYCERRSIDAEKCPQPLMHILRCAQSQSHVRGWHAPTTMLRPRACFALLEVLSYLVERARQPLECRLSHHGFVAEATKRLCKELHGAAAHHVQCHVAIDCA
jgi:hypothetical protein